MEKVIVANWKAWIGPRESDQWLDAFLDHYRPTPGLKVVVAMGYIQMAQAAARLQKHEGIAIAAQLVSPFPVGGYTGAVPASWLKGLAHYVLVGHRERGKYFHESDQDIARQVSEARYAGLIPIICMDRATAPRRLGLLGEAERCNCLYGYTPTEADALECVDDKVEITESVALIASLSGGGRVLYGGGVDRKNCSQLLSLPGVTGLMAGRGCLNPLDFAKLVAQVAKDI